MRLSSSVIPVSLVVALFSGLTLSACTAAPEWTLFFYPQPLAAGTGLNSRDIEGYYETEAQCQAKGRGMVRLSGNKESSYLCLQHCRLDDKRGLICQQGR
jgi:O-acetyl-ADP-ribose deacetylase